MHLRSKSRVSPFRISGWSGGALVLGKLPVPRRPTNLDYSRAKVCCACSRCGWGLFGHFFSRLSFLFSFSLSRGDGPIQTEILSQRAVKPKTSNQPILFASAGPSRVTVTFLKYPVYRPSDRMNSLL